MRIDSEPRFVDFAMHRVRMLYHFGVTPYLVFDGDRLPNKAATENDRAARRRAAKKAGEELLRAGKVSYAYQELQKAVDVTPEMARQLIDELKRYQVQYVVAPFEADSQLAYLEQRGIIDGIISEDSDLLVFGAKTLLTKLDQYGECVKIEKKDFNACREVSFAGLELEHLRRMAILSGCDYLAGLPKMGLKTAHRLIRKCRLAPNPIERLIQLVQLEGRIVVRPDYLADFHKAERTFLYQWVYCPQAQSLVHLNLLGKGLTLEDLPFIGEYVEPVVARGVAEGILEPMTKKPLRARNTATHKPATSPLRPKVSKDGKASIDRFFRPVRTPLAELDVNSLQPSPSQQDVLSRNVNRTWPADPSPLQHASTAPRTSTRQIQSPLRPFSSAPQANTNKRSRLCAEEDPPTPGRKVESRSKFFSSAEPSPSLALAQKRRSKKPNDVQIFSDDSIEDAMVALPDVRPSPKRSKTENAAKAMAVFKDSPLQQDQLGNDVVSSLSHQAAAISRPTSACRPDSGKENMPAKRDLSKFKLPEPKPFSTAAKPPMQRTMTAPSPACFERHITSAEPFASVPAAIIDISTTEDAWEPKDSSADILQQNLLAEAKALRDIYSTSRRDTSTANNSASTADTTPQTYSELKPPRPNNPLTPPATSKTRPSNHPHLTGPSSCIKETPLPPTNVQASALNPKTSPSSPTTAQTSWVSQPNTLKAKGSEDLLIVPDSDVSDASGFSPENSPTKPRTIGPAGVAGTEDKEGEEGECGGRPILNLKKFMFASDV